MAQEVELWEPSNRKAEYDVILEKDSIWEQNLNRQKH